MEIRARVAANIKRLRTEAKLSQEELGHQAGLHRTYISSVERQVRNPTVLVLAKIAKALAVDVVELVALPSAEGG